MQYSNIMISGNSYIGRFPDIGDDISPAAPPGPSPACQCRTGSEAAVQILQPVQPLGPQLILRLAYSGLGLGWCQHHST